MYTYNINVESKYQPLKLNIDASALCADAGLLGHCLTSSHIVGLDWKELGERH